jgi:hypothetical protein
MMKQLYVLDVVMSPKEQECAILLDTQKDGSVEFVDLTLRIFNLGGILL